MEKIRFGGDYNPEQWPEQVWNRDLQLFHEAGVDTLTVNVFSWATLQPEEHAYDFTVLDRILASLAAAGKSVCLATSTAAHPAWMAREYPDVTRVDFEGRRHVFGQRHNSCPNSPAYRRFSVELARRIAARYGGPDHPAAGVVVAWHVNNEYGGTCYCEHCGAAFRVWLRERYATLDALNEAWNTAFWSHTFHAWEEIVPPSALSEHWGGPNVTAFQGITLDYLRFNSDAMLANFIDEKTAIREFSPDLPVTTNFMGMYRPLDYFRWAPHLDFISWDNYPPDMQSHARMALTHDLMRGLKGGQPFWLMEQTPSKTSSRPFNPVKRPGVMRLWSYQAVAHGADAVLFFQMRQSRGASEKEHGAVINHAGRSDTRAFRDVAALGKELTALAGEIVGARTHAKVALVFDWDSWWAVEISDGPSRHVSYQQTLIAYYRALYEQNVAVDVVPSGADLAEYDVVVAPLLHVIKGDVVARVEAFVEGGGVFVTSFLSGRVDESCNDFGMDSPGPLARVLGIRIDETDALAPEDLNAVRFDGAAGVDGIVSDGGGVRFPANLVFDLVQPLTAEVVGVYESDFYAGMAAVTRNVVGNAETPGEAWYVGTNLAAGGLRWLLERILRARGLLNQYCGILDIEAVARYRDDVRYLFLLNHADTGASVVVDLDAVSLLTGTEVRAGESMTLPPKGVVILKSPSADPPSPQQIRHRVSRSAIAS
jgi:beta-galactosidase